MCQRIKVGVLACQGSFAEHLSALEKLDLLDQRKHFQLTIIEVRTSADIHDDLQGLIIPGGESTTLNVLLNQSDFFLDLQTWFLTKPVVWGTCAGMILLSDNIKHSKTGGQLKFGGVCITTSRNFFGRQKESFVTDLQIVDVEVKDSLIEYQNDDPPTTYSGIFIRAPGVVSIDDPELVRVLANLNLGERQIPVALRQENLMVTAFHPELTDDLRFHKYFIDMIIQNGK